MLPSLLILRAGFLDPIWNIGDELFLLVWLISGVFAIEAFFLKLMAYRCSDTWLIGAVFDFFKVGSWIVFCEQWPIGAVLVACGNFPGFENGLAFSFAAVVAYRCKTRCTG